MYSVFLSKCDKFFAYFERVTLSHIKYFDMMRSRRVFYFVL